MCIMKVGGLFLLCGPAEWEWADCSGWWPACIYFPELPVVVPGAGLCANGHMNSQEKNQRAQLSPITGEKAEAHPL